MAGRYYDEWIIGDQLTHEIRRTVTETDNLLFSTMTHNPQPPAIGKASGVEQNGGRAWTWMRVTQPTGDVRILRIDIAVADATGTVQVHLTVVRPPNAPTVTTS